MRDVNWWLMTLSFLLGLVLTLALTIRKVTREVPVTHTVADTVTAAGAAVAAGVATKVAKAERVVAEKVDVVERVVAEKVDVVERVVAEKVDVAHRVVADKADDISTRITHETHEVAHTRVSGPAGYTVKGDKDTMRYFTAASPDYDGIEAEVWFADEESAEKSGFRRWDS